LLNQDGYTIRGVQQLLAGRGDETAPPAAPAPAAAAGPAPPPGLAGLPLDRLRAIRRELADALAETAS
jgi:hypothetical protein